MALLQALLTLVSRSAGKILNAIFGWAVRALFGRTSAREQTVLSGMVAAAVAWPLLLLGIALPKVAAFSLAFVPIPRAVPAGIVRLVWTALAVAVPLALGLAVAAKAPPSTVREPIYQRLLRGFPITLGLAAAFMIMFVSVPILRLVALVRRQASADVPLVTDVAAYHEVAALAVSVLNRHGFDLRPAVPGWWVSAPIRILGWFGGEAFRAYVPQKLEHFASPTLELSFYPSGLLLRGKAQRTTWAHGLLAEAVAHSRGLQTQAADAQEVERRIHRVWNAFDEDRDAHTGSAPLLARIGELTRGLGRLDASFDDWQILYRQLLQLERAVRGQRQLFDEESGDRPPGGHGVRDPENQPRPLAARSDGIPAPARG